VKPVLSTSLLLGLLWVACVWLARSRGRELRFLYALVAPLWGHRVLLTTMLRISHTRGGIAPVVVLRLWPLAPRPVVLLNDMTLARDVLARGDVFHTMARENPAIVSLLGARGLFTTHSTAAPEWQRLRRVTDPMLASDAPPTPPPGSTRLVAFSLNGRRDAWRVGLDLARAHPLQGAGVGAFAKAWTRERSLTSLYILQPHSIEIELLSERGIVGLGLFAAFVASLLAAVVRAPARAASAAGLGVTIALLAQASFDWTWSFVGIVAPALTAAAAAASGERAAPTRSRLRALSLVPAALAIAAIGTLYLADRQLSQGVAAADVRPTAALEHARAATTLDPWLAGGYELQGRIAEAAGDFRLAAERYRTASGLSRRPWLDSFREARALDRLGLVEPTRQACAAAHRANPGEPMLSNGPCVR